MKRAWIGLWIPLLLCSCSADTLEALRGISGVKISIETSPSPEALIGSASSAQGADAKAGTVSGRLTPPHLVDVEADYQGYFKDKGSERLELVLMPIFRDNYGQEVAWHRYDIIIQVANLVSGTKQYLCLVKDSISSRSTPRLTCKTSALSSENERRELVADVSAVFYDEDGQKVSSFEKADIQLGLRIRSGLAQDSWNASPPATARPTPTPANEASDPPSQSPAASPSPAEASDSPTPDTLDFEVVSDIYQPADADKYKLELKLKPVFKQNGQALPWFNYLITSYLNLNGTFFSLDSLNTKTDDSYTLSFTGYVSRDDAGKKISMADITAWVYDPVETFKLVKDLSSESHSFSYTITLPEPEASPEPSPSPQADDAGL